MTPQQVDSVVLTADGRVRGDRVLGFRFNNAGNPADWTWQTKHNFVGLVNTPALAKLTVEFDSTQRTLRVHADELLIADGSIDSEPNRAKLGQQVTDYVLTLEENPLSGHPERQPVVLVGDGIQPLFHDSEAGLVTLHSTESLDAVGERLNDSGLDGRRFRSNIAVSGVSEPFEELSWVGRQLLIGATEFTVVKPVTRCLVTHANPSTGKRDCDVLNTLTRNFTPEAPRFAVSLKAVSGTRRITIGDEVIPINQASATSKSQRTPC